MKELVVSVLKKHPVLKKFDLDVLVEKPKDDSMGDFALPCFSLAKDLKKNPVEIAQDIAASIKVGKEFEKVNAVGPYVNFFVNVSASSSVIIESILKQKKNYGVKKKGTKKVMIEFSQANTHKAFHVGHIRGTSLGESLARIMTAYGDKVTRANYQGDTGMHVAKWIWNYLNHHKKEKISHDETWFAKIYVEAVKRLSEKPELESEVIALNKKLEEGKDKELAKLWKETRKECLASLEVIYKELETHFDEYFFESEVEVRAKEVAYELVKKGIAKESEGAVIVDFADHNLPELGVWVLLRKDGTVLYSSKDVALAERKFGEFKIDQSIYVVGAAQRHHMYQLFKTLELMKFKQADKCRYVPVTEVRLPSGKMSSRTGDNIIYSEFMKELKDQAREEIKERFKDLNEKEIEARAHAIALASLKYSMLKQDTNKVLIFDKNEALRFEGDTGPYLLYSYARAQSILRKSSSKKTSKTTKLSEKERALVLALNEFPNVIEHAYTELAPNEIAHYAYKIAQEFNEFYHAEKVIGSDEEGFRLRLTEAFSIVLKNALCLLGMNVIESM